MPATKEAVLREIPTFSRDGEYKIRPAFKELHRVLSSQKLTEFDLEFLRREIVARRKRLGFDEKGA